MNLLTPGFTGKGYCASDKNLRRLIAMEKVKTATVCDPSQEKERISTMAHSASYSFFKDYHDAQWIIRLAAMRWV